MQYINVKPQTGLASCLLFSCTVFYEKWKKNQIFSPIAKANTSADLIITWLHSCLVIYRLLISCSVTEINCYIHLKIIPTQQFHQLYQ